eukprot:5675060-Prorocentrum_lima.AAC.1
MNTIEVTVKMNGQRPRVKGTQVPIFPELEEDEGARKVVEVFDKLVHEKMSATIGKTPVPLESTEEIL